MERCISSGWRCLLTCMLACYLLCTHSILHTRASPSLSTCLKATTMERGKEGTLYFGPHGRGKCGFDLGANEKESMLEKLRTAEYGCFVLRAASPRESEAAYDGSIDGSGSISTT